MQEAVFNMFEDIEEEFAIENETTKSLEKIGDLLQKRFHTLAKGLAKLENFGWKWTTGQKTIFAMKDTKKEFAFKDLKDSGMLKYAINRSDFES